MGYLDNTSITVDAVLTKKGRELLKSGGNLNITSFTCSDTGVDYSLWNPLHPDGTDKYGEAIENLPQLEASVHAEYNLRNRLISLHQNTVAIPALILGGLDSAGGTTKTYEDGTLGFDITTELVGYSGESQGKYVVLQDPSLFKIDGAEERPGTLSGTSAMFLTEQDIPHAKEYHYKTDRFKLRPRQQDVKGRSTNLFVVDIATAAYASFTAINNVTKNTKNSLATQIQGSTN